MAASQITRDTWTDGVGGTTIGNSALQNNIYARIDELLAGTGSYSTLTFGNLIAAEGYGTYLFSGSGSANQIFRLRNTSSGSAATAQFEVGTNNDADQGRLVACGSGFSSSGTLYTSGITLRSMQSGGLNLAAEHASGPVRLFATGTSKHLHWNGENVSALNSQTGDRVLSSVLSDSINTTTVGTDGNTTAKTLHSYTMPASTLSADGRMLRFQIFGRLAANSNTKTLRFYFGGTNVADWDASGTGTNEGFFWAQLVVIRTGASSQLCFSTVKGGSGNFSFSRGGTPTGQDVQRTSTSHSMASALNVVIQGQNAVASASDIVVNTSFGELLG